MSARPRQAEAVEVSPVEDGFIVYDPVRDRVHHLNQTAAVVFELCTGEIDSDEIVRLVQAGYGLAQTPAAAVDACLAQLREEGLVV